MRVQHLASSSTTPQCFRCAVSPWPTCLSPRLHVLSSPASFLLSLLQGPFRYSMFSSRLRVFCTSQRVLEDLFSARGGDVK